MVFGDKIAVFECWADTWVGLMNVEGAASKHVLINDGLLNGGFAYPEHHHRSVGGSGDDVSTSRQSFYKESFSQQTSAARLSKHDGHGTAIAIRCILVASKPTNRALSSITR